MRWRWFMLYAAVALAARGALLGVPIVAVPSTTAWGRPKAAATTTAGSSSPTGLDE